MNIKGCLYRIIMKISHKYNWHYMKHSYPEGDHVIRFHWCGARYTVSTKISRQRALDKLTRHT